MDWMQFVSAIIASLAWPAAVLAVVLLLRDPLAKLVPLIRTLKFKDLHIDLGEKLEAVKEAVKEELEAKSPNAEQPPPSPPQPGILELALLDPRAAVLTSWVDVERALRDLAHKAGVGLNKTPVVTANLLHAGNVIDEISVETLRNLRRIRNDAAHLSSRDISYIEAKSMADMCQWLVERLRTFQENLPAELSE